jgi:hypothetical protein
MKGVADRWKRVLKKRFRISTPAFVGKATSVYAVPAKSTKLVNRAWKRWEN